DHRERETQRDRQARGAELVDERLHEHAVGVEGRADRDGLGERGHAHDPPAVEDPTQVRSASRIESGLFVAWTFASRSPARTKSASNSARVRSSPPGPTIMLMSSHLLQSGALPAAITRSITSTRPSGRIASRQCSRIRCARASSQSWRMYFMK